MAQRASLPHVDPSIEAALIAGGVSLISIAGTVVIGAIGFRTTRHVSSESATATAENSLRARLWDKQSDVYVETIKIVRERQDKRRDLLESINMGAPYRAYERTEDWDKLFPRLLAYAAPQVRDAVKAAMQADGNFGNTYDLVTALAGPDRKTVVERMEDKIETAEATEEKLIDTIRADLRKRPGEARTANGAEGREEAPS
jgi:hypothetical protein